MSCDFLPVEQPSQSAQNLKQKTETNHKPKSNKSSKEEPFYDYDDDYDDLDSLNPQQQEYFADYLCRQQEQSAQVKQVEQEEQLQLIDHDTSTDEENELFADAADVAEANTTENEDVEPEMQEQPDLVAQPTMPDQEVTQKRPQRNRQPPDYLGYNWFGSPYYIHHLPVNLRAAVPPYHCTPLGNQLFSIVHTANPYVLSSLHPYQSLSESRNCLFDINTILTRYIEITIVIIHLLDRTETNIIFIWSGKVILGEAKPSHNITLPDQINMILGEVLSNKCFIIPAHVVCTRSTARFIDLDQEGTHQVACRTPLHKSAYFAIYFRTWNFIVFELAMVCWNQVSSVSNLMNV